MPQGVEVYNASAQLISSPSSRLMMFLGAIQVIGSGSVTNEQLSMGTPFVYIKMNNFYMMSMKITYSISGNTLSWTVSNYPYSAPATNMASYAMIVYGIQ